MDKKSKTHLQNLNQKMVALLHELKDYSDAKLNEQPKENAWSVLQIMQHVMKAEAGAIAYVQKKLSFDPTLEKAGVKSSVNSLLLNLALSSPIKVKAPEQISGENLLAGLTFWDVAKQWKDQRKELEKYLENLPPDLYTKDVYKHPLTGKMTLASMLSFFNTHVDRHTSQIRKTLKKIDAVKQL